MFVRVCNEVAAYLGLQHNLPVCFYISFHITCHSKMVHHAFPHVAAARLGGDATMLVTARGPKCNWQPNPSTPGRSRPPRASRRV